jgi:hypothetical protein
VSVTRIAAAPAWRRKSIAQVTAGPPRWKPSQLRCTRGLRVMVCRVQRSFQTHYAGSWPSTPPLRSPPLWSRSRYRTRPPSCPRWRKNVRFRMLTAVRGRGLPLGRNHIKTVRQEFRRPACADDATTGDCDPPYRFLQFHVVFALPANLNPVA